MTWSLNLAGSAAECHVELEEKVQRAKEKRTQIEQEHIDAAVQLFKHLVPNDPRLACVFSVAGHSAHKTDVSFNSSCQVSAK
jgi:hypothetical protein